MKALFFFLAAVSISFNGYSQKIELPELEAHFSALIVKDINVSITWYSEMLGFKTLNKREYPEMGFKQANLSRGSASIELIELNTSVSPSDVIPNYNSKTRLLGLFKIGFLIAEFDTFVKYLTEKNAEFHGNVVVNKDSGKRMVILKDPDDNRIQLFEN